MEPRAASEGVGGKTDLTETLEMASLSSESGILRSYTYINEWVFKIEAPIHCHKEHGQIILQFGY